MPRRSSRPSPSPRPPRKPRAARRPQRLSVALACVFVCVGLSACKTGKSSGTERPGEARTQAAGRYALLETSIATLPDRPLLIPLRWTGESAAAPASVQARTDAGSSVTLPVRRLGARPPQPRLDSVLRYPHWPWAAPPAEVYEMGPGQNGAPVATYVIMLDDPQAWPGAGINIGADRAVLVPVTPDPDEPSSAPFAGDSELAEPDATSPLDAVRRALWRRHVNPDAAAGEADETSLERVLGRQTSGRWMAALRDLTVIDESLSRQLQTMLIRTAWDGPARFAAWPAWDANLSRLEAILLARLTEAPRDEEWRLRLRSWLSSQPDAAPWIESDAGLEVRLACANLSAAAQSASMSFANPPRQLADLSLAPASVGRARLGRDTAPPSERLIVRVLDTNRTLALLAPSALVLPPGYGIEVRWRSWTLATWLAGQPEPSDPARPTALLVRRHPETDEWQLTISCTLAQPLPPPQGDAPQSPPPTDAVAHWSELVGYESLTILLGPFDEPVIALTVLPDGSVRDWQRSALLDARDVTTALEPARWTVTLSLPRAVTEGLALDLGLVRMHEGSDAIDCFPRPGLPWRADPGRWRFDLSRWDPFPTALPRSAAPNGSGE
ncbi:MAG: hypothetical protein IT430_03245 [Phycisphaerales bacterium]|nr:hypothetical protein [Phycisphaerales bacterium]